MKLSIIVPVYNMAADGKLEYCLDSLLHQTLTDMEVIDMCRRTEEHCNGNVRYSDTAGVRQLLFLVDLTPEDVLNEYYG